MSLGKLSLLRQCTARRAYLYGSCVGSALLLLLILAIKSGSQVLHLEIPSASHAAVMRSAEPLFSPLRGANKRWIEDEKLRHRPDLDGYEPADELVPMELAGPSPRLLIHTWHTGPLFPSYDLLIASALVTQDLERTKLIIWMAESWVDSEDRRKTAAVHKYSRTPHRFVEFRTLNLTELAYRSQSCWKDRPEFLLESPLASFTPGTQAVSDVVRVLLLAMYGGVWVDSDTTFLVDLQLMHQRLTRKIASGRLPPHKDDYGNTNLLYAVDPVQRRILLEISCEFRVEPRRVTRTNFTKNEMLDMDWSQEWGGSSVIRPVLSDGTEMRVFAGWWWNDGVIRVCEMMDGFCNHHRLNFGSVDPLWMGAGGLYDFCEKFIDSYHRYSPSFTDLIRYTRRDARDVSRLWASYDLDNLTLIAHDRKSHCRSLGTAASGTLRVLDELARLRLGADASIAPVEPLDFLAADSTVLKSASEDELEFLHILIFVKSVASHTSQRQILRSQTNLPEYDASDQKVNGPNTLRMKLVFVVEYVTGSDSDSINGQLFGESIMYKDIILVSPTSNREEISWWPSQPKAPTRPTEARLSQKHMLRVAARAAGQFRGGFQFLAKWKKDADGEISALFKQTVDAPAPRPFLNQTTLGTSVSSRNWGEASYSGDGPLSTSLQRGVLKWLRSSADAMFGIFLETDRVLLNYQFISNFIVRMLAGELYNKNHKIPAVFVPLTESADADISVSLEYPAPRPDLVMHDLDSEGVRALLANASYLLSRQKLRKEAIGYFAARNIWPLLFDSDHPVFRAAMAQTANSRISETDCEIPQRALLHGGFTYVSFAEPNRNCTLTAGKEHPINARLARSARIFSSPYVRVQEGENAAPPKIVHRAFAPDLLGLRGSGITPSRAWKDLAWLRSCYKPKGFKGAENWLRLSEGMGGDAHEIARLSSLKKAVQHSLLMVNTALSCGPEARLYNLLAGPPIV